MDINLSSQIVVQTAAQWAADNTVYSAKRILVTSDAYYGSTDQRKFKIADGVQTWAQLDYMPIAQTLAQVLANGSSTNAISFKSPDSQTDLLIANNNIDSYVDDGNTISEINITPTTISISTTGTSATLNAPTIYIDAPTINLTQGTASRIVETDASKNLTYAAKGTAYNKNFGTGSGEVCEGNDSRFKQVTLFYQRTTDVTYTGFTGNTFLEEVEIPANYLGPNSEIEVSATFERNSGGTSTNTCYVGLSNSSSTFNTRGYIQMTTAQLQSGIFKRFVFKNGNDIKYQQTSIQTQEFYNTTSTLRNTVTLDRTQPIYVSINGHLGTSTDSIIINEYRIMIYNRA